jgi:hypothetical protein
MAGFTPEETHFVLKFQDPALDGLEATVREISTGELLDLAELLDQVKAKTGLAAAGPVKRLLQMVGDGLVEWNLTDRDGQPVLTGYDGLVRQPLKLALAIAGAWTQSMASVDIPLPTGSSGGETSLEPSIPMDVSSPSPGS